MKEKRFRILFHFNDFYNINFGINICLNMPNIELHIPFGFFRIGWDWTDNTKFFEFSSKKMIQEKNKKKFESS
jgi:hypothetical protein